MTDRGASSVDLTVPVPEMPVSARLGARAIGEKETEFLVWAPLIGRVEVEIVGGKRVMLEKQALGYHRGTAAARVGDRYWFWLDGTKKRADPAGRFMPEGVAGPSEIVSDAFAWTDHAWKGLPLESYVIYELHVGTFTPEGTFEAAIQRLPYLKELGVNAIEIMPVAQFPGGRNWGYDGVYPFAAQDTYGGPAGLKTFVNACHNEGFSVVLDVVYNHLGPEGNYLSEFGPYFTDRYKTPWGTAINYDDAHSDHVRRYFLENARYWVADCRIDALRADAVHAIYDFSAKPFLAELCDFVRAIAERQGRRIHTIAESDLNDTRVIRSSAEKGWGFDAQWSDDFHHALHVLLTGDRSGYYEDFGGVAPLRKALTAGYAFTGDYSTHRKRRHGDDPSGMEGRRFVVFSQNHDQVGNRMKGERLSGLAGFEQQKQAAAAVLIAPFLPMLFMGEEYGESAPFQYFISHLDPELVEAVRKGRRAEFAAFGWRGEVPDPGSEETFARCRINPALRDIEPHRTLFNFYKRLIALRREIPALALPDRTNMRVESQEDPAVLTIARERGASRIFCQFNFSPSPVPLRLPPGSWTKRLDSSETEWRGAGVRDGAVASSGFVLFSTK